MTQRKRYDDSLRLQIIEEYLNGASKYSLVKKYNLGGTSVIYNWLRIFGIEEPTSGSCIKEQEVMSESEAIKQLKKELRLAKKALAESELKVKALDRMIDISEERFKIPIRKKPGTKQ
jgi:Transposase and inactivated derivatives